MNGKTNYPYEVIIKDASENEVKRSNLLIFELNFSLILKKKKF